MKKIILVVFILTLVSLIANFILIYYYRNEITATIIYYRHLNETKVFMLDK